MKKLLFLIPGFIAMNGFLYPQVPVVLTFTGTLAGSHHPADSIFIENLTQGGMTMLYGPDTTLTLFPNTGVQQPGATSGNGLAVHPAFPNPFSGGTTLRCFISRNEQLDIRVFDLLGREVVRFSERLPAGGHLFTFYPGTGRHYFISVEAGGRKHLQKLIHAGRGGEGCSLDYLGPCGGQAGKLAGSADFLWEPGDDLRFVGYSSLQPGINLADTMEDHPVQSQSYAFQYKPVMPPLASFTASSALIQVGSSVQFTDLSTGYATAWLWLFGDGDSSAQQHPLHTYQTPGIVSVTLIATNASGSDTLVRTNYITVTAGLPVFPVYDHDGNGYDTVHIGSQVWLKQNLMTTKFNDGTGIPCVSLGSAWSALTSPGCCWFANNQQTYGILYGALYNWYAVATGKLCPVGWHVPTAIERDALISFLGGVSVAGGALKSTSALWANPNTGATNSSGFAALPGGRRYCSGASYEDLMASTWFWTSTDSSGGAYMQLEYDKAGVGTGSSPWYFGCSVRCLQD